MKTVPGESSYPLSPMQQGMLFHSLDARKAGVDIEQILCRLHEDLQVPVLERAWRHLVERHDIFRTSFHWTDAGEPCQTVHPRVRLHWEEKDWRGLSVVEREHRLETYLQAERRRGFNLALAPLARVTLIRIGDADYWLLWTFHHLLLDGRAVHLACNEVFAIYEAGCAGRQPDLAPPRPYRDYIDWLQRQDRRRAEKFWRNALAGFLHPTVLAVDRGPGVRASDAGSYSESYGEQTIRLSVETTTRLRALATRHGATLNTLLHGAWALLLSRYSGEEDVVFGAVRACRRASVADAESIVGLFINTVPVRVRVSPATPLGPWLEGLRADWVAMRQFEHSPLSRIQGWSQAPKGQPLFQTLLNFQEPSWDAALRAQGGLWATREFTIRSQSNYPLVVDAVGGEALRVNLLYERHRFEAQAVARLGGHLQTLLEGLVEGSDRPLAVLPWLTPAEHQQLVLEWNQTRVDFPQDQLVPDRFEELAAKQPQALAVAAPDRQLTYGELNQRAERLAARLRELGVSPDQLVAVCVERSAGMIVAWLAAFKAGGAYLPLDPDYPAERLAFMLDDARPRVLITQRSLSGATFGTVSIPVLCVDDLEFEAPASAPVRAPRATRRQTRLADLAYVVYTSGSTGRPKGVEVTHGGLLNLVEWHQRAYQVVPADRATQIAGPSFDAAVWEVWPYLTAGASICLPDDVTRVAPGKLLAWLARERISLAFLPTPLAEAVLQEPWPAELPLRALLTGGEKLHRRPPENLPCCLVNHYGPTENSVVTTWATVMPALGPEADPPPIGRPIANTQVYVLDRHLQPVPIGLTGELYVGGPGLARGYRQQPALTTEKFIPHPFSQEPGARLYRTGDLARFRPDGNLEFVGRADDQVKIRGHRIELGEVETVLGRHPAVREVVMVAREDAAGESRLVAYVVPAPGAQSAASPLREFLKRQLPEAMVPAVFVFLEALPLTPNGKVDRKALPPPDPASASDQPFVAPRTPVEQELARIWAEILHVERIGIGDHFFDLGGHSLLATQVLSRVRRAWGLELPLRAVFEAPTLAALAQQIEAARGAAAQASATPARPAADHGAVPLSFAQERLWFLEQLEPGRPFNNIPAAIRLEGRLELGALEQSLTDIVDRHDSLRTTFRGLQGQPSAAIAPVGAVALPVVDLSAMPAPQCAAEARRLAQAEAQRAFDLSQSPLLRARLLRLGSDEHWLLLTMHHIVSDGWSLGIFYRELAEFYRARLEGRPAALPDLPGCYVEFARQQRQALQSGAWDAQLDFWKRQLGGSLPALELPTDRPRPATQTYRGAVFRFDLPGSLGTALTALSRRENVTLFMLLLAAFKVLLHRYTQQEDLLVGTPIAGRTQVEFEELIGFFLNTLVLRTDLTGDPTFRELLQRVRRGALDAYAHPDVPLEKLVEELQPQRDLSRSPLFQVMFVLQNMPLRPLELPGLKLTPQPIDSGTAKFDLTLWLTETPDGLAGAVEYNTDLFEAATIERLTGHYRTLLEAVLADPAQPLSRLPLLTAAERHQLLVQWNQTQSDYPRTACVHH
ncbi:MAG: amino acid adenylation domain-containing protein, partial [Verrucomicrobia bacterium]|nr:amino acid adenylation domain-containing protein [Verrucomicrobiota bacterium]